MGVGIKAKSEQGKRHANNKRGWPTAQRAVRAGVEIGMQAPRDRVVFVFRSQLPLVTPAAGRRSASLLCDVRCTFLPFSPSPV
jgi:hypothetical protein